MNDRAFKKVIIDAYRGGADTGNTSNNLVEKDFNLDLSKYIYNRLITLGIPTTLTRDGDYDLDINSRINKIKSIYGTGNDIIVLSNALTKGGDGAEIVYALRNSSTLSKNIAKELETIGVDVSKYYQRRLPSDTSQDYYQLIRDTLNNESIIVFYGNTDNEDETNFLRNNVEAIGEAIVIALSNYLNVNYVPVEGSNYYIVKKGDSLYSIANKYNTTVSNLKSLNNLATNNLSIGQVLKIPTSNSGSTSDNIESIDNIYIVKSGDNLYKIATIYNTTVDEIKALNNLTTNNLSIGQKIKIPKSKEEVSTDYLTYKVKSGDTLYSIAKAYNVNVDTIKNFNNLTSNLLSINQILRIPTSSNNNYDTYKVKSGDTLYSIAKTYNTSVSAIKELNNLTSNTLSIGQILNIPKDDYVTYTVKKGDSLYSIAKTYNTSVDEIKMLNNLSSNLLSIGDVLKIPS